MSYQALIQELLDPKAVPGQQFKRAPNSLEIRAAKAIYSLLIDLKNLNETISQTNGNATNPDQPASSTPTTT